MGIRGAAISTLISYSISGYFAHLLFRNTRENFFRLSKSLFTLGILDNKKGYIAISFNRIEKNGS
jgi:Na+-driven multidrug efflux pump